MIPGVSYMDWQGVFLLMKKKLFVTKQSLSLGEDIWFTEKKALLLPPTVEMGVGWEVVRFFFYVSCWILPVVAPVILYAISY